MKRLLPLLLFPICCLGQVVNPPQGGGGSAIPGGSNLQVQFNNNGTFGGSSVLVDAAQQAFLTANINTVVNVQSPIFAGGAKCDWKGSYNPAAASNIVYLADGAISTGTTFTSAGATFTSADTGKWISIQTGAFNTAGNTLVTKITFVSTHVVTLAASGTNGSSYKWSYGSDDSAAFMAAKAYVDTFPVGSWPPIELPAGICMASVTNWQGESFNGKGMTSTYWLTKPGLDALVTNDPVPSFAVGHRVTNIYGLVDASIDASCSAGGTCAYPHRVSGTAGGLTPFGLVATTFANPVALPVGGTIAPLNGGSGYGSAPTVTVTGGGPHCVEPTFTAQLTSGSVSTITLVTQSSKCTQPFKVSFSGGSPTAVAVASIQLTYPAIITDDTGPNPGLVDPPWYVGNAFIATLFSNPTTGGQGPNNGLYDSMEIHQVNNANLTNHTAAIFTNGDYQTQYSNLFLEWTWYGIVYAPYFTTPQSGGYSPDTDHFTNIITNNYVPLVFYNGNFAKFDHVSTYGSASHNTLGIELLGFPSSNRAMPGAAEITNYYFECFSPNTNEYFRLTGNGNKIRNGALSCPSSGYGMFNTTAAEVNGFIGPGAATNQSVWVVPSAITQGIAFNNKFYNIGSAALHANNMQTQNNYLLDFGASTETTFVSGNGMNRITPIFGQKVRRPLNCTDGGAMTAHSSAPFACGDDLLWTPYEQAPNIVGSVKISPSSPTGILWDQPLAAGGGGSFAAGNNGFLFYPFTVGQRVPQSPVTVHFYARITDANGHSGPQRTTWQTATGSSTLGTIYYRATTTQPSSSEGPPGPENIAVGAASQNVVINSPIDDCVSGSGATWNLYASTVTGTEELQNGSPIACGTAFTFTAVPTTGGAAATDIVATQAFNMVDQPANKVTNGTGTITLKGYWQDLTVNADFSTYPQGSNVLISGSAVTVVAGSPSSSQFASISIEPQVNGSEIASIPAVTGLVQGTPLSHDMIWNPLGIQLNTVGHVAPVADPTAPYTLQSFFSQIGTGGWNTLLYNAQSPVIGTTNIPYPALLPPVKGTMEVIIKMLSSSTTQTFEVLCGVTNVGSLAGATVGTSYTSIQFPFDLTNGACTAGTMVTVTAFTPTTPQESQTAAVIWHFPPTVATQPLILIGTTGSIGGGALTAGTCASGTATVTGVSSSMGLVASPSNTAGPGAQFHTLTRMSAANTVTVDVCTDLAAGGTPTATTYNVRAIP